MQQWLPAVRHGPALLSVLEPLDKVKHVLTSAWLIFCFGARESDLGDYWVDSFMKVDASAVAIVNVQELVENDLLCELMPAMLLIHNVPSGKLYDDINSPVEQLKLAPLRSGRRRFAHVIQVASNVSKQSLGGLLSFTVELPYALSVVGSGFSEGRI